MTKGLRLLVAAVAGFAVFLCMTVSGSAIVASHTVVGAASVTRPLIVSSSSGIYSMRPDGTNWRQVNDCTLNPITTNGREVLGLLPSGFNARNVLVLPVTKEVVGDCEDAGDPVSRRYERRRLAGFWMSLDWSPTVSRVVGVELVGSGGDPHGQVVVFNSNGTGRHAVVPRGLDTRLGESASSATWSPAGNQIVFGREIRVEDCPEYTETRTIGTCRRRELVRMNADGTGAVSLYRPPQIDEAAADDLEAGSAFRKLRSLEFRPFAWHGNRIFMVTNDRQALGSRIAVINADGSGFKFLTAASSQDRGLPALSPDGRQIAMVWDGVVYLMSSKGGPLRKLRMRPPILPRAPLPQAVTW